MTEKKLNSRSTTLDSLLNTLRKFLGCLRDRNESWLRNRKFAHRTLRQYREDKEWHKIDADFLEERISYNDAILVIEELVSDLIVALEDNPYPGNQKRLVPLAAELFPCAAVVFAPNNAPVRGEGLWVRIFEIGNIVLHERICFPVKDTEISIDEVEAKLWVLVREDNTLLAGDIPIALNLTVNSNVYRATKSKLEKRGWCWGQRREQGKKVKIVTAPSGTAPQSDKNQRE